MRSHFGLFLVFLTLVSLSCNKEKDISKPAPIEPVTIQLTEKAAEIINYSNGFGINLFAAVSEVDSDQNLMLSPLSASVALSMLLNGCDGDTYIQIRDMLGFENLTLAEINSAYQSLGKQLLAVDPEVKLGLANAVWYRLGFNVYPSYLDTMHNAFDAHVEGLDFSQPSALETMNGWASDNTNGKIEKVLDEISPDAVMFLMNALYYKGTWTWQFDPAQTHQAAFILEDGAEILVPMMYGDIPAITYYSDNFAALELFYGRTNFSMIFVLPGSPLSEFIADLDLAVWNDITNGLDNQTEPQNMDIYIPKFSFEYEKMLNDQLQNLGMTDAFVPGEADLSGISGDEIFVSFVKQNTFVEVNEEGTEAAAVTTIGIDLTSANQFVLNKSFIFAIRERTTNTVLFIGKLMNPLE